MWQTHCASQVSTVCLIPCLVLLTSQTFPVLLYLHKPNTGGDKACEQRLSSVHFMWTMHSGILWMHTCIFSTYVYWLFTCLLDSTWYAVFSCQPKLFLCAFTIVINSKREGVLKPEYQSLCSIVYKCLSVLLIPKIMEELSLRHWVEYQCNTSIETIMGTTWEGCLHC